MSQQYAHSYIFSYCTLSAGSDEGLQLVINAERYEYMPGPHDGAGCKVLVHHPTDVPLVKDLGQSIPAGSLANVGVQVTEV